MKVQIYSQWMEDVYIPARIKQFTKAAKLCKCQSFVEYANGREMVDLNSVNSKSAERKVVAEWLDNHNGRNVAVGVA